MRIDRVVAAFSEAAVDSSSWLSALETASEATDSFGAILFDLKGPTPQFPLTRSMEASFESYRRDGWITRDERFGGLSTLMRQGVVTDLDIVSAEAISRRPYYQEFLAPYGLRWFAGVKVVCGDVQWILSLQRTITQGPFSPEEQEQFKGLSHALSGVAAIVGALGLARADAALAAFELSGAAVALFDRFGRVMRHNAAAERLFGPDLAIRRGRLTSSSVRATAAFDRALHALLWSSGSVALLPPVVLPRLGKRPVLAYPARLSGVAMDVLGPFQALVILVDLDARSRPPEGALRSAFGLTEAESRLASRIAAGEALDACASQLNVSYETARSQLRAIFAKTNTHRQPELVALLARVVTESQ